MSTGDEPASAISASTRRKLAAILHADVAGYSRLMAEDETGTHARLISCLKMVERIVSRHDGRVVGTAGDAVLADFPSVIEALAAAVDIQEEMTPSNADLPPAQQFWLRIGVNLGDVIVAGDDIYGDGVNVAARVQALADPGGIAITGAVHEQIKAKFDLAFRDCGSHRVKNIDAPLRIFAATPPAAVPVRWSAHRSRRSIAIAAMVIGCVVAAFGLIWVVSGPGAPSDPAEAPSADEMPEAAALSGGIPTIAVLPFENRSGDPAQTYFSDGVTEDVITDLGRFSNLRVLSWNAVAAYRGETVSPQQIGRDLEVRYVVGGSLRLDGDQLRVTVQLTDTEQGVLLWSERYDGSLDDVFAVQDEITQQVVGTLAVRLTRAELDRAHGTPTDHLGAYDHVLRGRDLLRRIERDANFEARDLFERAIALDRDYADAHVGLGFTHLYDFMYGWTEWMDRAADRAQDLAEQAIRLDDRNAAAHGLLAHILTYRQQYGRGVQESERAIELNPNNALNLAIRGTALVRAGRPEEALASLELALRLDPYPIAWWVVSTSQANYYLGRYEEAVRTIDRYGRRFEEDPVLYVFLAAAHGQLGQRDEAAEALAGLQRISPFFNPEIFATAFADPEHRERLLEGLRKAGLE